ncbi:MAG: 16S rRNA (cytidine(1402)-2'-O)-methyltransferase [Proteobacteria bacterium]|nr:16S rRNA (cytidine(1402)-2'-O)-methyltransferase [Pseudomonadota bacterium]MCP4921936.1 16S rRNA (cytidine(1402)-2'-O)-methyltransferase [Pseudomonadota bacterium]
MLHVLATPIGNLGDLSPRARQTLVEAQLIAAEDTRVTRKLLAALDIPAPELVSYRGQDEEARARKLVERIVEGTPIVLVSDAGTPAISDPGQHLVAACHERGIPVRVVPGASSTVAALSVSGLPAAPAHWLGFPPRKAGPLRRWLLDVGALRGTLVLLESPRRTPATVRAIAEVLPDRSVAMCRELSKLHEEVLVLPAPELAEALASRELKGEVVLVVGPGLAPVIEQVQHGDDLKGIAAQLAERWGCTKREAYNALLALERSRQD